MSAATVWEYAFAAAVLFVLPIAVLACGLLATGGVSPRLRIIGLVLLACGALVVVRQVLRTGVGDLMPQFAVPALVALAVVYPLAAIALVRAASPRDRSLATPRTAAALLVAAAAVQFVAPWMLVSGE